MFNNPESQKFSSTILFHRPNIANQFGEILGKALVNAKGEVDFLKSLADDFSNKNAISLPDYSGLEVFTWAKMIHQRPYVSIDGKNGPELGDLLVSVRYELSNGEVEEKSIIYQVKLETSQNSDSWRISHNQIELLTTWPKFKLALNNKAYEIFPKTKDASSYLLLRKPTPQIPSPVSSRPINNQLTVFFGNTKHLNYGHILPAIDLASVIDGVQDNGVKAFSISTRPDASSTASAKSMKEHTEHDWMAFMQHIAFQRGENLQMNLNFKQLIEDTFSFVGGQPKATDLSHGYFCAIRITVKIKT